MREKKRCAVCGEARLRVAMVSAGGGYAPDVLPGAHPWWKSGKLEVQVCVGCGHVHFFVPQEDLAKVTRSSKFKDVI